MAYLQQTAKQGSTTAVLYLAYLHAKGLYVPQSLQKTAQYVRFASSKGDWRATRFWAELLVAVPLAARELLEHEIAPAAEQWRTQHPNITPDKIEHSCRRFYEATAAIKYAAKLKFEQAVQQGSPSAMQRMKGLILLSKLPTTQPATQFQSIGNWLDLQFSAPKTVPASHTGKDVTFLPDNIPLLPQGEDNEKLVLHRVVRVVMVGLILLFLALFFAMGIQTIAKQR